MKTVLFACALTPGFFPTTLADTPLAQPAEGTVLGKVIHYSSEIEASGLEVWMGGEAVPATYLPELEMQLRMEGTHGLIDHYESVKGGELQAFVRQYDEIAHASGIEVELTQMGQTESYDSEADGKTSWAGRSVRFQQEEGIWSAALAEGEESADGNLEGLTARLDFAAWALPLEQGAKSWSLEGAALEELIAPAGNLSLEWPEGGPGERMTPRYSGDLEFTLVGAGDADVREVRISGTVQWTEVEATDLTEVPVADGEATMFNEQDMDLEGTLLWNSKAGHLISLELDAEMTGKSRIVRNPDQDGPSYESHTGLAGEMSWKVEFQVQDA